MIDKIDLHIPFLDCHLLKVGYGDNESHIIPVKRLPLTLTSSHIHIKPGGTLEVSELRTKFESLDSGHSGMALKVYDKGLNCDPFVSIKCSPASLVQGFNAWGFDNFRYSVTNMLNVLALSNPALFGMLDLKHASISVFDVTYSSYSPDTKIRKGLIEFLGSISNGQTRNRGAHYELTSYFGSKNSRLKTLKVYCKYEQVLNQIEKLKKDRSLNSTIRENRIKALEQTVENPFCKNAIRFEASIKKRYLERRNIPTNLFKFLNYIDDKPTFYNDIWNEAFRDVFKTFEGKKMKFNNDDEVYNQIDSVFRKTTKNGRINHSTSDRLHGFYNSLKFHGYENRRLRAFKEGNKTSFYRNVGLLLEAGFSKAHLQNLHKESNVYNLNVTHTINIDFSNQCPPDYVLPANITAIR